LKKIMISLVLLLFTLCLATFAEPLPVSQKLSLLDRSEHSPQEFFYILKTIRFYNQSWSFAEIADTITASYSGLKKSNPGLTVYDVALGIKRFSSDTLGIRLQLLADSYIKSQS